jgi:hypothetical protein
MCLDKNKECDAQLHQIPQNGSSKKMGQKGTNVTCGIPSAVTTAPDGVSVWDAGGGCA